MCTAKKWPKLAWDTQLLWGEGLSDEPAREPDMAGRTKSMRIVRADDARSEPVSGKPRTGEPGADQPTSAQAAAGQPAAAAKPAPKKAQSTQKRHQLASQAASPAQSPSRRAPKKRPVTTSTRAASESDDDARRQAHDELLARLRTLVAEAEALIAAYEAAPRSQDAPAARAPMPSLDAPFAPFMPLQEMATAGARVWLEAAQRGQAYWLGLAQAWLPGSATAPAPEAASTDVGEAPTGSTSTRKPNRKPARAAKPQIRQKQKPNPRS